MKRLLVLFIVVLFLGSCNNSGSEVVSLDTNLVYLNSSRGTQEDIDLITILDIWVVPPDSPKPVMNPSDPTLKTPATWSTTAGGDLSSIELLVSTNVASTFWLRLSATNSEEPGLVRDFVGSTTAYITANSSVVEVSLYETPSSILNGTAWEYEEYIENNF